MKDLTKLILILLCGGIGAGIPVTGFYLLWSYCVAQIPAASAYAGLIKVGVTFGCVIIGGGATVGLAILGGILAGAIAVAVLES